MRNKVNPQDIWAEYEKGKGYNINLDLYNQVEQNENFYIGKQWEGVKAPDLDKPVLNVLKRVVTYLISALVTDNVGISITPQREDVIEKTIATILENEVDRVVERNKLISLNRSALRNACVDGKAYYYGFFNTDTNEIETELVENTRVIFGNPFIQDIQKQPYILIVKQMLLDTVKEMVPEAKRSSIRADVDEPYSEYESYGADRTTVLIKLWKQDGQVHFTWVTKEVVIKEPTNTGYSVYPLAAMTWESIRDSYQGQAAVTGLIPNQIVINKLWAMAIRHQYMLAFPKVIYDRTKLPNGWTNRVGEAIAVTGNPNEAVAANFRAADMSAQLLQVVDSTINYTKEMLGASDAALGNVRPDNTSAIIALQKASSAPLELQKLTFYQFIEDYVRVILELITAHYGLRPVTISGDNGERIRLEFNFDEINADALDWRVDVGASAYWSEMAQIRTLDALFDRGILTDVILYLENIPDEYIKNKNDLIENIRKQKAEVEAQMQQTQMMGGAQDAMPTM